MQKKKLLIFENQRNEHHNKFNLSYYFNKEEILYIIRDLDLEKMNME